MFRKHQSHSRQILAKGEYEDAGGKNNARAVHDRIRLQNRIGQLCPPARSAHTSRRPLRGSAGTGAVAPISHLSTDTMALDQMERINGVHFKLVGEKRKSTRKSTTQDQYFSSRCQCPATIVESSEDDPN
ncbi:hypothetical protein FS842_004005 [Serendipita sp. 407]|nr:hypothetical protein FS842_004005 [Serendipita sp. 407]